MLTILVAAIIGGIGFRLRGSAEFQQWTGRGATTARIVCWALPCGIMTAVMLDLAWWWALAVGFAAWVGCLPPWWRTLTMGRNPQEGTYAAQAFRHAARGVLWGLPMAVVLGLAGAAWLPMLLASLTCWPAYELGYRISATPWGRRWGGTEYGEALFGAAMGAAIAMS